MWPNLWSTAGVFIQSLNGQLFTHILPLDRIPVRVEVLLLFRGRATAQCDHQPQQGPPIAATTVDRGGQAGLSFERNPDLQQDPALAREAFLRGFNQLAA